MMSKKIRYETPRNCDELVDLLMSDLMSDHLDILAQMTDAEFEKFYDAVGGCIIEEFNLWTGNERLLYSCLFSGSFDHHEVDPAWVILKKMRDRVRQDTGLVIIT